MKVFKTISMLEFWCLRSSSYFFSSSISDSWGGLILNLPTVDSDDESEEDSAYFVSDLAEEGDSGFGVNVRGFNSSGAGVGTISGLSIDTISEFFGSSTLIASFDSIFSNRFFFNCSLINAYCLYLGTLPRFFQ